MTGKTLGSTSLNCRYLCPAGGDGVHKGAAREGLLSAREGLFRRMHQILEQRERLVATLQAGFPSTDTEHANAPLYVAVRPVGPALGPKVAMLTRLLNKPPSACRRTKASVPQAIVLECAKAPRNFVSKAMC